MHLALAAFFPEACWCCPWVRAAGSGLLWCACVSLGARPARIPRAVTTLIAKHLGGARGVGVVGGSQWPGLLEALLMSGAPGATARAEFWLRPWVGPEGHVQGLCPGQPGAEVWG